MPHLFDREVIEIFWVAVRNKRYIAAIIKRKPSTTNQLFRIIRKAATIKDTIARPAEADRWLQQKRSEAEKERQPKPRRGDLNVMVGYDSDDFPHQGVAFGHMAKETAASRPEIQILGPRG